MRIFRVKALETYDRPTAEELPLQEDDIITICATTRAEWKVLGFSYKPETNIAPRWYFHKDASGMSGGDGSDYLLLGTMSRAVDDAPCEAAGPSSSRGEVAAPSDIKRFKITGTIGIVHSRMVKVMWAHRGHKVEIPSGRVANLREDQVCQTS